MLCVGVSPFGFLRKNFPGNGDGHFVDDDPDGENVDVSLPKFPIGAIHGEDPASGGLGDFTDDEAGHLLLWEDAQKKEALKSSIRTFVFCSGEVLRRQQGEVDGAFFENTCNEEGQDLEEGEIEIEE